MRLCVNSKAMQVKVQREKESSNGTIVTKMEQWKKIVTPGVLLFFFTLQQHRHLHTTPSTTTAKWCIVVWPQVSFLFFLYLFTKLLFVFRYIYLMTCIDDEWWVHGRDDNREREWANKGFTTLVLKAKQLFFTSLKLHVHRIKSIDLLFKGNFVSFHT